MLWKGYITKDGYGQITFRHNGRLVSIGAHRVFAILAHCRDPIPLGMDVGHSAGCSSRACVRHLELQPVSHNHLLAANKRNYGHEIPF